MKPWKAWKWNGNWSQNPICIIRFQPAVAVRVLLQDHLKQNLNPCSQSWHYQVTSCSHVCYSLEIQDIAEHKSATPTLLKHVSLEFLMLYFLGIHIKIDIDIIIDVLIWICLSYAPVPVHCSGWFLWLISSCFQLFSVDVLAAVFSAVRCQGVIGTVLHVTVVLCRH